VKILVACEESQAVTKELRKLGHEAYSCDLIECSGENPEWHIIGDAIEVSDREKWDYIISFQPCTDITVSGARWFEEKRKSGDQENSIRFFFEMWKRSNASENPIGILNKPGYVKQWFPELYEEMKQYGFPFKPTQIIQPWQFGHGETKATCLWIKGLPKLEPTDIVEGREQRIWKLPPSKDRAKLRSKTYEGIAKAMADQWFGESSLMDYIND